MKYLLSLITITACASGGGSSKGGYDDSFKKDVNSVKENKWPSFSCSKKVGSTIRVGDGKTFDGGGCEYIWTGKDADKCDAAEEISENEPKMFELGEGATLKNIGVRCSPDGIELKSNSKLDNVKIRTEEDAMNMTGSVKNVTIKNTDIYYSSDKAFQGNPGIGDVTFDNVRWFHASSPIKYDGKGTVTIRNSKFYNFKSAIGAQQSSARIVLENVTFEKGTCVFRKDLKAKVTMKNVNMNGIAEKCK